MNDLSVSGAEVTAPLSELDPRRVWGMIESAPDGMLMTDGDGIIRAVNQQVERLFGYERADLLGRGIEVLLPEHLRDVHRAHRTRYRAEPTIRSMGEGLQLRARRHDGSEFPVEVSLSPLVDDEGLAVVASIRDITERQRVSAHSRRIQAAVDAIHDGVFMFDPHTLRFVYANAGASAQTGYSNDELLTMTPLDIKPEFTRARFESFVAPLLAGEVDHVSFRTVHRRKTGEDVSVDIVLEHRRDEGESTTAGGGHVDPGHSLLVAVVRDVSDQVAVERRLVLSERTFRASFDNAPVGMAVIRVGPDGIGVHEMVNRAFADLLGRSTESLVGGDVVELLHPVDRRPAIEAATEMARGERSAIITERRYRCADGSHVWTLIHASVIERSSELRILTHVVDITDRRERQAEQLRSNTMEDRERIARDIHDLVIQRLFGAGMKMQATIPEMQSQIAVARTHEIIDELDLTIRELRSAIFELHHRDTHRSVADDISLAVEQSVDRLGLRPNVVMEGPIDSISESHGTELVATIREALSNVARHAGASAVDVRLAVDSSELELTLTDDGCGIDPDRPRGNGLSNMAERAAALGGTFAVRRIPAGGTELVWTVPR